MACRRLSSPAKLPTPPGASAGTAAPAAVPRSADFSAWPQQSEEESQLLWAVRKELARLRGELERARGVTAAGAALATLQQLSASDAAALAPWAPTEPIQCGPASAEEGKSDAAQKVRERRFWAAEVARLEGLLEATRSRIAQEGGVVRDGVLRPSAGGEAPEEARHLLRELATQKSATAALRAQVESLRLEVAAEHRAAAQAQQARELEWLRKRMEAERSLRRAQRAELLDVERSISSLRGRLRSSRSMNAELVSTLELQRSVLERLRSGAW